MNISHSKEKANFINILLLGKLKTNLRIQGIVILSNRISPWRFISTFRKDQQQAIQCSLLEI